MAATTRVKRVICFAMANQNMAENAIVKHTFGEMAILLSTISS
jgi:hypothetical protein